MHSVLASDDDDADTMAFPVTRLGLAVIAAAEHSGIPPTLRSIPLRPELVAVRLPTASCDVNRHDMIARGRTRLPALQIGDVAVPICPTLRTKAPRVPQFQQVN